MRLANYLAIANLCLSLSACSTPEQSKARLEFARSVDELCNWTRMTRSGLIRGIECCRTDDPGWNVAARLNVDGSTRPYIVRFDSHRRLLSFTPEPFNLGHISLGSDTVNVPDTRSRCVAAVNRLNRRLRWTWYGPPAIQPVGSDFIVTYVTVSPAEERKHMYFDPYVSFLVSPKGTVFAAFFVHEPDLRGCRNTNVRRSPSHEVFAVVNIPEN